MDTIRLKFRYNPPPNSFYFKERIHSKELDLKNNSGSRFVYTNNKWRKGRKSKHIYTPKYWIEDDFLNPRIKYFVTEFSVGKAINKENLTDIKSNDINRVVRYLKDFFKEIGIYIFESQILNSVPIVLSFGKNINITKLYSCSLVMRALQNFNDRFCSDYRMIFFENKKGEEIYFNSTNSTFKVYSKIPEICNNAVTEKELNIAKIYNQRKYGIEKVAVLEVLRFEETLKKKQAIIQKAKKYIKGEPTFEKWFNEDIWNDILKSEVSKIYSHPLKSFIFLTTQNKPVIDAFLNKNFKGINVKNTIYGILTSLQEKGLKGTRNDYFNTYKSRQTWYNYIKRIKELEKCIDYSSLKNITSIEILDYILQKFDIKTKLQTKFDI